jgi:hypothetical protein
MMAALTCIGANAALKRANNYLELPQGITATAGKTVVVDILMSNTLEIINWQAELVLPEGITLVSAEKTENWAGEVTVTDNKLFSEVDVAAAASQKLAVAKLTLNVASTVKAGEYQLSLDKIVMTASDESSIAQDNPKSVSITVEEAQQGIEGDLNGDSKVTASDIQVVLNAMTDDVYEKAYDLNDDGKLSASDIQVILNIIAEQ